MMLSLSASGGVLYVYAWVEVVVRVVASSVVMIPEMSSCLVLGVQSEAEMREEGGVQGWRGGL